MGLTLVKELGMQYATPDSKHKRKMALYECSGCGEQSKRQVASVKAGYTHWCIDCGIKQRKNK